MLFFLPKMPMPHPRAFFHLELPARLLDKNSKKIPQSYPRNTSRTPRCPELPRTAQNCCFQHEQTCLNPPKITSNSREWGFYKYEYCTRTS